MLPTLTAMAAAVAFAALALAGCDREYVYLPTVATTSAIEGGPSSSNVVSPATLQGDVQLTSFGFADIQPGGLDEARERALHVRMMVANDSDKTWFVDASDQLIALPEHSASRPALATSDRGAAPTVAVPPGGKRTIDLFYALPQDMKDAKEIPAFDTVWTVQAGPRVVTERTAFQRLEVQSRDAPGVTANGWGAGHWYDPANRRTIFVGVRIAPGYEGRPVE
jgi:hypothetical protein